MKEYYCWRCDEIMPFLNEEEWAEISPMLDDASRAIKEYRRLHECDLRTARLSCRPEAMEKFEQLTGRPGVNFDVIFHHRLRDWGSECTKCGHLLRSPKAKLCANCGATRKGIA